jgi:peptidoglycan/LPS O-acetylase OafA/YrhL
MRIYRLVPLLLLALTVLALVSACGGKGGGGY